jgi:hypothetical protein
MLEDLFPGPDLKPVFERWGKNMEAIMNVVREAK